MTEQQKYRRKYGLRLIQEAAAFLGVSVHWLRDHRSEFAPSAMCGKRACFTRADLSRIKAYITLPHPNHQAVHKRMLEHQGYYTIRGAAEHLGIPIPTITIWVRKGLIQRPRKRKGALWYYDREDLRHIQAFRDSRLPKPDTYTLTAAAKKLGVGRQFLSYHLARWLDLGVRYSSQRRSYTLHDIAEIRRRLLRRK